MSDPLPAIEPSRTERRIVVGVDGSESSKHALRWAATLALAAGSELHAVQSWDVPTPLGLGYVSQDVDLGKDTEKWLEETVNEVFGVDRPAGLRNIVYCGSATRVLLDASKNAQLLVVGSRGRGGFLGLLLGSVSSAVAEHAPCPVLVVHGDQRPIEFTS